jgi:hypothetical protein
VDLSFFFIIPNPNFRNILRIRLLFQDLESLYVLFQPVSFSDIIMRYDLDEATALTIFTTLLSAGDTSGKLFKSDKPSRPSL